VQSSSTQCPSSFPSHMVSKPTRSHDPTLHAFKSALDSTTTVPATASPDPGLFHKMVTSSATRDCSMSPTIRMSGLDILRSHHDHRWLDTLASPKHSRTSVVSSIGPEWSPSSPTTSTRAWSAVTASPSITSPMALPIPPDRRTTLGLNLKWTSLRGYPCQTVMTRSWW